MRSYPMSDAVTGSPRSTWQPGTFRLRYAKLAPDPVEGEEEPGDRPTTLGISRPKSGIRLIPLKTLAFTGIVRRKR